MPRYAVAESLADSEEEEANPLLPMFLAKLPVIPFHNNTRVISTALDCIGGFSDWLAVHPHLLPHVNNNNNHNKMFCFFSLIIMFR